MTPAGRAVPRRCPRAGDIGGCDFCRVRYTEAAIFGDVLSCCERRSCFRLNVRGPGCKGCVYVTLTHWAPIFSLLCERRAADRRGAVMDRRGCAGLRGAEPYTNPTLSNAVMQAARFTVT